MADPANTNAAASTSRRKRALPTQQPRAEAKRLRTTPQEEEHSPVGAATRQSQGSKSKNKAGANSKRPASASSLGNLREGPQGEPATSSVTPSQSTTTTTHRSQLHSSSKIHSKSHQPHLTTVASTSTRRSSRSHPDAAFSSQDSFQQGEDASAAATAAVAAVSSGSRRRRYSSSKKGGNLNNHNRRNNFANAAAAAHSSSSSTSNYSILDVVSVPSSSVSNKKPTDVSSSSRSHTEFFAGESASSTPQEFAENLSASGSGVVSEKRHSSPSASSTSSLRHHRPKRHRKNSNSPRNKREGYRGNKPHKSSRYSSGNSPKTTTHNSRRQASSDTRVNHLSRIQPDSEEEGTTTTSSSSLQPHKYPLRSQSRSSTGQILEPTQQVYHSRRSAPERGRRELVALGATGSHPSTRGEEQEQPSRLTRSGAVLRRSTRNSKGHSSTTGSCASSSGASGSGSSSRRAARQHKVGAATPALLTAPASQAAAAMAAEQPEMPNNGLSASEEPPSPQEATQAMQASGGGPSGPGADSESDDSEVGRLQALLEARGLPPHLFGALGPRMQHLLHRSMGSNTSVAKAQALLPGLQATGDEGQQLQAVIEMCQILVMGNEEILTGFPVKQVVPALITLLQMEHNFDIMNHACRALTYMMEALPRSSAVVVDAVPVFLEKLQVIQCMDVAEQSLTALDMLSRRHSKAILQARGVSACLTYLDFFSINAQRNALSITANCCVNLTSEEFIYVKESLSGLAERLTIQDKKCVESVCLAFSRIIDSYQLEPARLQEIASNELLTNLQHILLLPPQQYHLSSGTFITVLRMLSVMCANCPDLALTLLKQNIADTLVLLLTGSSEVYRDEVTLVTRQPQEQYEITTLIGELMPKLPSDGIFAVDALLERPSSVTKDQPVWQWRDDRGVWHAYGAVDSRIIEAAHLTGDDEVSLNTLGRIYTVDFNSLQQINEDTGTSRPVQRRYTPVSSATPSSSGATSGGGGAASDAAHATGNRPTSATRDARVACLREERGLAAAFIRSLFSVLYEVYSSSAGPAVRCKCLRALLRMVYYASPELLKDVLKNQVVSSHIAGMMASSDLRIVVGALQMAEILMNKLPDDFGTHFKREGVIHQINRLADPEIPLSVSPPKTSCSSASFSSTIHETSQPSTSQPSSSFTTSAMANGSAANNSQTGSAAGTPASSIVYTSTPDTQRIQESDATARTPSPSHVRLSDVLKRKRVTKRSAGTTSRSKTRHDDMALSPSLVQDLFTKATSLGGGHGSSANNSSAVAGSAAASTPGNSSRPRYSSGSGSKTSFLQSLNPARWGRSMNSSHDRSYGNKDSMSLAKSASNSHITAGNREKTRTWIRDQASKFLETYSASEADQHREATVIDRLKNAIEKLNSSACTDALVNLRVILMDSDVSPFEVNHAGLITSLLNYLCDYNGPLDRDHRLRILLNVFAGFPLDPTVDTINEINSTWMGALVNKINGCVTQMEQFPVKVHDLPANSGAGRSGTSALKFFNTHQLKCNLQRHPDCTNLKQWKGGTVKIDPLALVQAIERYLCVRGYGRLRDKDSAESDEADTDEDLDDNLGGVVISQQQAKHKLQFLIGNNVLPYNMTVYQAVKQFSSNGNDQSETDTDNETPLGNAGIWVQTHVIYYRPEKEKDKDQVASSSKHSSSSGNASGHSSRKGKGSSGKSTSRRKADDLWNEGTIPPIQSPLAPYLTTKLPDNVTIQDASLESLCLLRILNAVNLYWTALYPAVEYRPILPHTEFLNSKIAAKANRQLQDPLVIMTGNLPNWLQQIASACPFLFPFETRQLLFYATSFDRDRALQRLLDMAPEIGGTSDSQERVTPRLERRKRTISREDVLKQAEQVMQELGTSKSLLEIQYTEEVGTGLGPTLEFYAIVSRELTRTNLELWNAPGSTGEYVNPPVGLFPAPLARSAKMGPVSKVKSKFRFLGKFMAKAVMDSRMLDLPFSLTFYRWLLGQEHSLTMADLKHVAPEMYNTLKKMHAIVRQRDGIMRDPTLDSDQKEEEMSKLEFDGCPISDLGVDFILPGHSVELMKNGKNTAVTIHNLHLYVKLVSHWTLVEGVARQMESLREGFETVFPLQNLRVFQPEELESVFCGNRTVAGWDVKSLAECCKPDHGYTLESQTVQFLFEVLSEYNVEEQRQFVQFITGSPRLPVGGFKALSPPLTVVRKTLEPNMNPDDFLPSVMTCVNYLKLPEYSSREVLRKKMHVAASEGQHSFHLS